MEGGRDCPPERLTELAADLCGSRRAFSLCPIRSNPRLIVFSLRAELPEPVRERSHQAELSLLKCFPATVLQTHPARSNSRMIAELPTATRPARDFARWHASRSCRLFHGLRERAFRVAPGNPRARWH